MGVFGKRFSPKADPDAERFVARTKRESEGLKKPKGGAYDIAVLGAQTYRRFFGLLMEFEAKCGRPYTIDTAENRVHFNPKLIEAIRAQPDVDALESALPFCLRTEEDRDRFNGEWPSRVASYRGKNNSPPVLEQKGALLGVHVAINLDSALLASTICQVEISYDQRSIMQVEEAFVWYRVLDEMATHFLHDQSDLLLPALAGELTFRLALMGSAPDLICETMGERSREYSKYGQWLPAKDEGAKGTLLWEAGKHVGAPIGLNEDPAFLMPFSHRLLEKLSHLSLYELLLGKSPPARSNNN